MKILSVNDKPGSAIDRLAKGLTPYMGSLEYKVLSVHPKRPDERQIKEFEFEAKDADLIDFQYFRTAEMLRSKYDWLKAKPSILTHHNPYSITESDWNSYDTVVANNKTIYENLGKLTQSPVEYIPNTVDTDFWTFNPDWSPNNRVLMVAARIEGKKGVLEVAQACKKIGARFALVGSVSDQDYFHEVIRVGGVEFYQGIPDEKLRELYWNSAVHVCNSSDNFESGTLPILEAMLCGTPVLTRKIGHVPELNNGENMILHENKGDVDEIADKLKDLLDNPDKMKEIREKAWQTAKTRSNERRAYLYQKLYREILFTEQSVSVIVPVCEKPELTEQCLEAIEKQTYKNLELIVVNDGMPFNLKKPNVPMFKLIENHQEDYGLARARNKGIIEASGEIIVFCDQRIVMQPNAIEELVNNVQPGKWVYGSKDGVKKEFVENFSAVKRDEIIRAGLFNERIDSYGGMSQEIRTRFRLQGNRTEYIETAKATQIGKSSNRNRKRADIIKTKNKLWRMGLE